ncbi:MAG: hypothetical protein IJF72_01645 [Clostridia bacterium]|nr:hypothetical protein [Clostridia bacterium]
MPFYSINSQGSLNIASFAPNGTGSTTNIGLGLYNYVNYSVGIWGDFQAVINERGSNMQLVKEVYLCIDGSDDIGAFYVTGFSTPFYCDENYVYRIPLHGGMTQNGQVNVLISCPGATTFTQLNAVTAHFEVEEKQFSLFVPSKIYAYTQNITNDLLQQNKKNFDVRAQAIGETTMSKVTDFSIALSANGQRVIFSRFSEAVTVDIKVKTDSTIYINYNNGETSNPNMEIAIPTNILLPTYDNYTIFEKAQLNAVITLHGGAWAGGNRGEYAHYKDSVLNKGLVYAGVDYSLITPSSNANNPNCNTMLTDIATAISTLRDTLDDPNINITLGKVALMGYSAGGHLALLYGLQNPYNPANNSGISLIVAECAPTDLSGLYDYVTSVESYDGDKINLLRILSGAYNQDDAVVKSNLENQSPLNVAQTLPIGQSSLDVLLLYSDSDGTGQDADINTMGDGLVFYSDGYNLRTHLANKVSSCQLYTLSSVQHDSLKNVLSFYEKLLEGPNKDTLENYLVLLDRLLHEFAEL